MYQMYRSVWCNALDAHVDKLEAYRIKRSYQLLVVLGLLLAVNVARLVVIMNFERGDLPNKTAMLFDGINYSMFAIALLEWLLLLISYIVRNNIQFTLVISVAAMVLGFILRFAYLFIPYRDLIDLSDDTELKTLSEWDLQFGIFIFVVLPLYTPNILLLRSCKQATAYLAEYYEAPDEKFFYILSNVFTAIYLSIVTIAYGVVFFVAKYFIALYANYVPIAWAIWFVGSILETYSVKPHRRIHTVLGVILAIVWWVLVIIALSELRILAKIITMLVGGWVQYLQLKLQLRDLFVVIDLYRKNTNDRSNVSINVSDRSREYTAVVLDVR